MPHIYNKETDEDENARELGLVVGPLATRFDPSTADSGKTAPPTNLIDNNLIAHAFLFPIQGLRHLPYAELCQRLHLRSEANHLDYDILTPVGVTRVGQLLNTDRFMFAARIGGIIMLIARPVRYDRDEDIYTVASEVNLTDNCGVAGFQHTIRIMNWQEVEFHDDDIANATFYQQRGRYVKLHETLALALDDTERTFTAHAANQKKTEGQKLVPATEEHGDPQGAISEPSSFEPDAQDAWVALLRCE